MAELKVPTTDEEFEKLEEMAKLNSVEEAYIKDMKKRVDSQFSPKDYRGLIGFYSQELQAINGRFGDRIAIERMLKYALGHACESLATKGLGDSPTEGGDLKERAEIFEQAILWYQAADETVGYYSDYAIRQSEACRGASYFRRKAGIEDEITKELDERGDNLIVALFGKKPDIMIESPMPEHLKQHLEQMADMADEKIEGSAKIYLFKDHSKDHERN